MLEPGLIRHVSTTAGDFWAVCFTGLNHAQILELATAAPPPPPGFGDAVINPTAIPSMIRLWDARSGRPVYGGIDDWIIVDTAGVLILHPAWFHTLFGPTNTDPHLSDPQLLNHIANLATQLLDTVTTLQTTPARAVPSPRTESTQPYPATGVWEEPDRVQDPYLWQDDILDARHLTQAHVPHISEPATPLIGDVWRDARGHTWSVIEPVRGYTADGGSWWNLICRGEDGQEVTWSTVQQNVGPLILAHRPQVPAAA